MKASLTILILLILFSCKTEEKKVTSESELLRTFDTLMTSDILDEKVMHILLGEIEQGLSKSTVRIKENPFGKINATVKFNIDSTVVLIKTNEILTEGPGFQRQVTLTLYDSIIFSYKFSALTEDNDPNGYELLEIVHYLTPSRNIKRLIKREFPTNLTDTLKLRRQNFEPYEFNPESLGYYGEHRFIVELMKN